MARDALMTAGKHALEAGNWSAARESFRAAIDQGETAEALMGLGDALWWSGETRQAITLRERAFAIALRQPDPAQAAIAAVWLCIDYRKQMGNTAASTGWVTRLGRLLEEFELEPMRGWLSLLKAFGCDDPVAAERWAREAHQLARSSADLDLELCAASQVGALLVQQRRIAEGLPWLDESMTGSLSGEGAAPDTVVWTSCNMIVSCTSCAEFERAVQWVRAADTFMGRYGCPFLFAECRTLYGGVLVAMGDWRQAEVELQTAIKVSRVTSPVQHRQALATLAELRVAQGRIEEAARLVAGLDDNETATSVWGRIHLLRGAAALAAVTVRRRLALIGEDRLESALLLELLGEAEIEQGAHQAAAERGRRLAVLGAASSCGVAAARGRRLLGRALAAAGQAVQAGARLDAALSEFLRLDMPYEAARTRLLGARARAEHEPEVAVAEAQLALAVFEDLGAGMDADATAALLRQLGVKAARMGPRGVGALTKREHEVLSLIAEGLSNPDIAARLYLSRKTVEHHVARVLAKLGVRSRGEAAAEVMRHRERNRAAK